MAYTEKTRKQVHQARVVQLDGSPLPQDLPVEIAVKNIADAEAKKIDWLWKGKIAYGKMTLLAGEPGVGKSQLLLYIASVVSNGSSFHLDTTNCRQDRVLLISGEDDIEDTIKPRLMALGAD